MNRLLLVPGALSLLLLAACGSQAPTEQTVTETVEVEQIPVEVEAAHLGSISAFYSATATLESDGRAHIVPRIAGQVVELLAEEGDRVEAGQVLARLDAERLRLELARSEAELSRLQQDLERNREMHARDMISTETFDRLKFEFDAQRAQYELARLELSYSEIKAPISGVVSQRMVWVGNMVNTSEPVFEITALDPLQAVLDVPERELSRLSAGQPALVQVDALPGRSFQGEVVRLSPVIDAQSGTFRVTVELADRSGQLRPGMFGRFSIVYDQRDDVVLVPAEALLTEDGRSAVFVVTDGKAERREVVPGYRNNGHYEITEGLLPGERVVVTGQASLRTGAEVLVLGEPTSALETESLANLDEFSTGDES
ncbi:efflux RND transporter periplasmic adaptor subunit [Wenzhouxiangella marina]|uniref:Hemolysin D n=1 Tax=Wenzhouxiangella marina TaxID=1579979 RepID=A0A0K0XT82_9GAMM|nr:efflux RND transporter periplasmic adaptor subunit [Wenzhouxiangella marina]AKS40832.1 hemolysin D [Wenzhouxiangella marina]MBB6087706.1 membrane fusion protein (multidrug efflux system) [Wenzhouxiangella marina]